MRITLRLTQFGGTQPLDITGATFAFIANQNLEGKTAPPVYVPWGPEINNPQSGVTEFEVTDGLSSTLEPGSYFFNITMKEMLGDVLTLAAGTWNIIPVPGLISGSP